jgi:hypothetical protein
MGQPIVVTETSSAANPGVRRFETNRALTGMGHERYRTLDDAWGERPPDVLARRLLELGGIDAVHINGNVVTVDLTKGYDGEGIQKVIEDLYLFYPEPSGS